MDDGHTLTLEVWHGELRLSELTLGGAKNILEVNTPSSTAYEVIVGEVGVTLTFKGEVVLGEGDRLTVTYE